MKILNYREGFAANSSSTHSTFFYEDADKIKDTIYNEFNFGWENFVLTSKNKIAQYIAAQVFPKIQNLPPFMILAFLKECIPNLDITEQDLNDIGVDHQSEWVLPVEKNSFNNLPSHNFIKDLVNYLYSHKTIITGGNDNDYEENMELPRYFSYQSEKNICKIRDITFMDDYICQKDPEYNYWVLFNTINGNKITLTFDDNPKEYKKSFFPQLVDLIISDNCYNGCNFCYRNCSPSGSVAKISTIENYLYTLAHCGTFEVAIGGGDILTYPFLGDLCDLVKKIREEYKLAISTTIKPPRTYGDFSKLTERNIQEVVDSFSSVAFSVDRSCDYEQIKKFMNKNSSLQLIPEIAYNSSFYDFSDHVNFTLLGYKRTGRGDTCEFDRKINNAHTDLKWFDNYVKISKRLCVDTQFLKNFPEIKDKLAPWMYTEHEGQTSCCINAITNEIAKSSYDAEWFKLNDISVYSTDIKKYFDKF